MKKYIIFLFSLLVLNNSLVMSCCFNTSIRERSSKKDQQALGNSYVQKLLESCENDGRILVEEYEQNRYLNLLEMQMELGRCVVCQNLNRERRVLKNYFWTIVYRHKLEKIVNEQRKSLFEDYCLKLAVLLRMENQSINSRGSSKNTTPCSSKNPTPQVTPRKQSS